MQVRAACKTSPGLIRTSNEDNVYLDGAWIEDGKQAGKPFEEGGRSCHVYAVCDGMGGESYGEVASLIAVKELASFDGPDLPDRFCDYIRSANRMICEEASRRLVSRMGAAIALLVITGDTASVCNLGDCRIYQYDERGLRQLSLDHRTDMPGLGKGMLSQHLGIPEEEFLLEPTVSRIPLSGRTMFLLCSDGLTDMVPDQPLQELLAENIQETPAVIAGKLLAAAAERGGRDNITALVVSVSD